MDWLSFCDACSLKRDLAIGATKIVARRSPLQAILVAPVLGATGFD